MKFEWDPKKAVKNFKKHQVSFEEAATVFGDPLCTTVFDPDHSTDEEERYLTVGVSNRDRYLIISHSEPGDRVRVISARKLTPAEREAYEETS
jgi:uncharacterized DUF497 family protein